MVRLIVQIALTLLMITGENMIFDDKLAELNSGALIALLSCLSCSKETVAFPDYQRCDFVPCKHCEAELSDENVIDWVSASDADIQFYIAAGLLEIG